MARTRLKSYVVAKLQLGQGWDFLHCLELETDWSRSRGLGREETVGGWWEDKMCDDNNRDRFGGTAKKLQTPQVPRKNVRTGL